MKTRIVVHIALNAKNERVGSAVEAAGRLLPFGGYVNFEEWNNRKASYWIDSVFGAVASFEKWKIYTKNYNAVRFQRVTVLGEANEFNQSKLQAMVPR